MKMKKATKTDNKLKHNLSKLSWGMRSWQISSLVQF